MNGFSFVSRIVNHLIKILVDAETLNLYISKILGEVLLAHNFLKSSELLRIFVEVKNAKRPHFPHSTRWPGGFEAIVSDALAVKIGDTSYVLCKHSNGKRASPANLKSYRLFVDRLYWQVVVIHFSSKAW